MLHTLGISLMGFIIFYFFISDMSPRWSTFNKTPRQIEMLRLGWSFLFALAIFLMAQF